MLIKVNEMKAIQMLFIMLIGMISLTVTGATHTNREQKHKPVYHNEVAMNHIEVVVIGQESIGATAALEVLNALGCEPIIFVTNTASTSINDLPRCNYSDLLINVLDESYIDDLPNQRIKHVYVERLQKNYNLSFADKIKVPYCRHVRSNC